MLFREAIRATQALTPALRPRRWAITQATPTAALTSSASSVAQGTSVTLSAVFDTTTYVGNAPTGAVTFYAGSTALGAPVPVAAGQDSNGFPQATATLATTALPVGTIQHNRSDRERCELHTTATRPRNHGNGIIDCHHAGHRRFGCRHYHCAGRDDWKYFDSHRDSERRLHGCV